MNPIFKVNETKFESKTKLDSNGVNILSSYKVLVHQPASYSMNKFEISTKDATFGKYGLVGKLCLGKYGLVGKLCLIWMGRETLFNMREAESELGRFHVIK